MEPLRRRFLHLAAGAAALPAVTRVARAQTYPVRPITMIVAFAAGGPADTVGRILAERMRATLGQPILVENVTGATGRLGVERAARAPADGYTLIIGTPTTHVLIGALYALQTDLLNDFRPIARLADGPLLIIARKSMTASNLSELMAWLRANPDKGSQGIAGVGAVEHVAGILLQKQTGTRFLQVPYRGTAPAIQDLVAGQIDMMLADAATSLPYKSLCGHGQESPGGRARHPDRGRGGFARVLRFPVVWPLGACTHSTRCDRQAQYGCDERSGAADSASAARRPRSDGRAARAAGTGCAWRLPEGRNREVVADHQGSRHQA
jgi:Tripartite tricarboxylate transporter family receptor